MGFVKNLSKTGRPMGQSYAALLSNERSPRWLESRIPDDRNAESGESKLSAGTVKHSQTTIAPPFKSEPLPCCLGVSDRRARQTRPMDQSELVADRSPISVVSILAAEDPSSGKAEIRRVRGLLFCLMSFPECGCPGTAAFRHWPAEERNTNVLEQNRGNRSIVRPRPDYRAASAASAVAAI